MRKFWVRLTQWEYWPFEFFYTPVFFYFLWLSIKQRSIFFFTSSNPSIDCGGMFGEKKTDIYSLIPKNYIPNTFLIGVGDGGAALEAARTLGYPLIAKPNIGERGVWIKKIEREEELLKYVQLCKVEFLLQELVEYPLELGVFYVRYPSDDQGKITSIVRKDFLSVVGNGTQTIRELLLRMDRAVMTVDFDSDFLQEVGDRVPGIGEKVIVEPIGNHSRGTQFLNDNDKINPQLSEAIDRLAKEIPDFFYGRFDLKCQSYEKLAKLEAFTILELNGAGAEPAHVYQPGYPIWKAYRDILWHFRVLAEISAENRKRGHAYWTLKKGVQKWKAYKKYYQLLTAR